MMKAKYHLFDAAVTLLLFAGLLRSPNLGPPPMPSSSLRPASCGAGQIRVRGRDGACVLAERRVKPPAAPRREAPAAFDDFDDLDVGSAVEVYEPSIHHEYAFVGTLGRKKAASDDAAGVRYDVAFEAEGKVHTVRPQFIRPLGKFDVGETAMCVKDDGASMRGTIAANPELVACTIMKPMPKEELDPSLPAGGYLVRFHDDGDDVLWRSISTTRIRRIMSPSDTTCDTSS